MVIISENYLFKAINFVYYCRNVGKIQTKQNKMSLSHDVKSASDLMSQIAYNGVFACHLSPVGSPTLFITISDLL